MAISLPTNWENHFSGPAWTRDGQWYLRHVHQGTAWLELEQS